MTKPYINKSIFLCFLFPWLPAEKASLYMEMRFSSSLTAVPPAKRLIGSRPCKCRPGPRIHLQRRYYKRERESERDKAGMKANKRERKHPRK